MDTELFPAGPSVWAVHEKASENVAIIQARSEGEADLKALRGDNNGR